MSLLDTFLGRPLASADEGENKIGVLTGIPTLGLDGLGSAAYGPEAALFARETPAPVVVAAPVVAQRTAPVPLLKVERLDPLPKSPELVGAQSTWEVTIEREGSERPVCVAESISRRYG